MSPLALPFTCAGIVILVVFYAFYFNRLVAWLLALALRLRLWDPANSPGSVHVSIEAVQFSLLSGRVLLKDVRYTSSNQMLRIVKMKITWKYWLLVARQGVDADADAAIAGGEPDNDRRYEKDAQLPCRLAVYVEGFEWFLYNRTRSYDDILARLSKTAKEHGHAGPQHVEDPLHGITSTTAASTTTAGRRAGVLSYIASAGGAAARWFAHRVPTLDWMEMLPVGIRLEKCAIVIGNPRAPSIVVARFAQASGALDVAQSRCARDLYKQVLNLKLRRVLVTCNANPDYEGSILKAGSRLFEQREENAGLDRLDFESFQELLKAYRDGASKRKSSSSHSSSVINEYAKWETVLVTDLLDLTYYADVPGTVSEVAIHDKTGSGTSGATTWDIGNGDLPPEWGVELILHDAELSYGPWTDRQRVELQRVFFPPTFHDAQSTERLHPGDMRVCVEMAVMVDFRGTTSLRIPFKETSKNWLYDELGDPSQTKERGPAWLDFKFGGNSMLRYGVPMVADQHGFNTALDFSMSDVSIAGLDRFEYVFLKGETCKISAKMPSPLQWKAHRQWDFAITLNRPNIHLLRDHTTLITDLIKDWTSGPANDRFKFIPTTYELSITLTNFDIVLYLNDHNIVDQLADAERNALLTLSGTSLTNTVVVASDLWRPECSTVPFTIEAPDVAVVLTLPKWNTHSVFATRAVTDIGRVGLLQVDGAYTYYPFDLDAASDADGRPELVDRLHLSIAGSRVSLKTFGWVIRHFMILKDNYFGAFTNQTTTNEYRWTKDQGRPVGDPVEERYRPQYSNGMEVVVEVKVEDALLVLPAGLTGVEASSAEVDSGLGHSLVLVVPEFCVSIRLQEYFMELSLNVQPIVGSIAVNVLDGELFLQHRVAMKKEVLLLDGIFITGNRLFGPLPRNATYLCLWEMDIGMIKSSPSMYDASILSSVFHSLSAQLSDAVNAPAEDFELPTDPDVTFLKVSLKGADVAITAPGACLHFALPKGVRLDTNNLASHSYSWHLGVQSPLIIVRCLVSPRDDGQCWLEAGSFTLDAFIDIYQAPAGWRSRAKAQRQHVAQHDSVTRRAAFLYEGGDHNRARLASYQGCIFLPHPQLPESLSQVPEVPAKVVPSHGSLARLSRFVDSPKNHAIQELRDSGDEDESTSDAERDARIVKSRPVTPRSTRIAYVDVDNDSLSSGDESDDAASTSDDSSSESEWSDGDGNTSQPWPFSSAYLKLIPQYKVAVGLPWDTPLVVLSKSPSLSKRAYASPHYHVKPSTSVEAPRWYLPHKESDASSRTTVRLRTVNEVDMFLSPLLACFVDDLICAQEAQELSLELVVDQHLIKAAECDVPTKRSSGTLVLDLSLTSLRVRSSQHIMSADEAAAYVPDQATPSMSTRSQIVSIIDLQLSGVGLLCDIPHSSIDEELPPRRAQLQYEDLSIHLREAQSHVQSGMNRSSRSLSSEVEARAGPLNISLSGCKGCVQTGDFYLRLQERSPEAVIGTVAVLSRSAGHCTDRVRAWNAQARRRFRRFSILAITASKHKPTITDPLSQAQPSFLLGGGSPAAIRSNVEWRILTHLRHCMHFFSAEERVSLHRQSTGLTLDIDKSDVLAVHEVLRRRLGEWVSSSDPSDPYWLALNGLLFPEERLGQMPADIDRDAMWYRWWNQQFSFQLSTGVASLSLLKSEEITNELTGGPLILKLDSRSCYVLPPATGTSASQISFDRSTRDIHHPQHRPTLHIHSLFDVHSVRMTISPNLIPFARHVIRVFRGFANHFHMSPRSSSVSRERRIKPLLDHSHIPQIIRLDLNFRLRTLFFSTVAQQIAVDIGLRQCQSAINAVLSRDPSSVFKIQSTSSAAVFEFEELSITARDLQHEETDSSDARDILASLTLSESQLSCGALIKDEQPIKMHAAFKLRNINLFVPRSIMRLYRLVEEWRRQYLPELELMLHGLVSEFDRKPKRKARARFSSTAGTSFDFHMLLDELRVTLQVMHGTWLCWRILQTVAYIKNSRSEHDAANSFGLEIGCQEFSIGPSRSDVQTGNVKLTLPACRLGGTSKGRELKCIAVIETFRWTFKPKHFDDILAIQQKFGVDFNELFDLVEETRRNRPPVMRNAKHSERLPWTYDVKLKLVSFRVGVAGPSSVQYFSASGVTGGISNVKTRTWHLSFTGLGLGLVRKDPEEGSPFHLSSAMAFISVDLHMKTLREEPNPERVEVNIPRLHAVMQPASIGELGDLIDYVQAEMLAQSEKRAAEIAEIRRKTKKVLRAWDVKAQPPKVQDPSSLFSNRIITLTVSNFGVAFPLSQDCDIALHATDRHASVSFSTSSTPAFLLSVDDMEFTTRRYEAGTASINGIAAQFVPRFDQALPSDFDGKSHITRNRMLYPKLTAEVRSQTTVSTRSFHILGAVDGFILDLHPSIATYVFALNDVYHQGKERMQRIAPVQEDIAAAIPRSSSEPLPQESTRLSTIPTSHIRLKLTFESGKVRLYSPSSLSESRSHHHESDNTRDIFYLPSLSVWTEYKAKAAARKFGVPGSGSGDEESATLLFSAVLHESHNTFKPSILPFLIELRGTIESRMRRRDARSNTNPPAQTDLAASGITNTVSTASMNSMRIHFSLSIDRSSLRLSCFPDVSIISGVYWKSGGFMITVSPGARKISFTGSIAGVTAELRHEYLKEVFFEASTEDLAFAVSFTKTRSSIGGEINSVSIVVDTDLTAKVNFTRLQDGYCFKAVWLDRLPVFESSSSLQRKEQPSTGLPMVPQSINKSAEDVPFSTLILVRSRRLALAVDLAQAATMTLDLNSVIVRTQLSETMADISVSFSDLSLTSERLISGYAKLPAFSFQTSRRRKPSSGVLPNDAKLLQLALIFEQLEISLLHGGEHKVFHYEAAPVHIHVYDDWAHAVSIDADEQQLSLNFAVVGTTISLAVGLAIARKVVEVQDKIKNLFQTQREGALRDSQAFRATWSPASANPLSDVANAMIQSARTRFKEQTGLSYVVVQKMLLKLEQLHLNVFPTFMTDDALATFQGYDLLAQLQRVVAAEHVPYRREMTAAFSSILISKFTGLPRERTPIANGEVGSVVWLKALTKQAHEEAIISIPAMAVKMISDETKIVQDGVRSIIKYRFISQFVKTERAAGDIYITLNYTHYTWLTNLKNAVEREIMQFKREKAIAASVVTSPRVRRREDQKTMSPTSPQSPAASATTLASPPRSRANTLALHKVTPSVSGAVAGSSLDQPKVKYVPDEVNIETPQLRQLGEATPSLDSSFIQSVSGIRFREMFPQYLHEFATVPLEEMMKVLLELYSKQLKKRPTQDSPESS